MNELKNIKPVVLKSDCTVFEAARAMRDNNVGTVLVANGEGELIGIVSDRDLACRVVAADKDSETHLETIMSRLHVWVDEHDFSIDHIKSLMRLHNVRRIPIVRQSIRGQTRAIGMVSIDDLIRRKVISIDEVADIINPQTQGRIIPPERRHRDRTARQVQRAHLFSRRIAESLDLSVEAAEELTQLILGNLLSRVQFNEAIDFLAQLPIIWKDRLSSYTQKQTDLNLKGLVGQVAELLDADYDEAEDTIMDFFEFLPNLVSSGEISDIAAQLPKDIQSLIQEAIH